MDLRGSLAGVGERIGVGRAGDAVRRLADRLAGVDALPTELRATLGHFARGGRLDVSALRLQSSAEDRVAAMTRDAFAEVEAAIAEDCGVDPAVVEFTYETKLLLPVELTLTRLYRGLSRRADDGFDPVDRTVTPGLDGRVLEAVGGESEPSVDPEFSPLAREAQGIDRVTRLVVLALLDGDMRDAVNDAEYDDFEASVAGADPPPERVARLAQETLEMVVERRFERFPDEVRAGYERAVEASEAHQARDPEYRDLLEGATAGDTAAVRGVRERYREAGFDQPPSGYEDADLGLPYFRTQYGRVGVIYDGMFDMYEAAGIPIDDAFRRAVVLTIVYAQVWLDDIDDYAADVREGQLTPVTGEYVLADGDREGYRRVRDLSRRYAERAREHAARSRSPLVGVAVEYVTRSGDPSVLPGAEAGQT